MSESGTFTSDFLGGLHMSANNSNEKTSPETKHDVLASTQTVIHKALQKLGYPEEVYELLKEPFGLFNKM